MQYATAGTESTGKAGVSRWNADSGSRFSADSQVLAAHVRLDFTLLDKKGGKNVHTHIEDV